MNFTPPREHSSALFPALTKGHFGVTKVFGLGRRPLFTVVRTRTRNELHLIRRGGKSCRLLTWPLSSKIRRAELLNEGFDAANLHELRTIDPARTVVLFVFDFLHETGGVECRVELFLDRLSARGIQPVIVAARHDYAPLQKYPCLRLIPGAPNAAWKLLQFVRWSGAKVVEFNLKSPKLAHDVDIKALRQLVRVGCMLHGREDTTQEFLDRLDYRCTVFSRSSGFERLVKLPNIVTFPDACPAFDPHADTALYVGRIDSEKLPTIRNFIRICERLGVRFEIAGPVTSPGSRPVGRFLPTVPPDALIGPIDTRAHLQAYGSRYLFVAGVGQVPLEAAAADLPALITPHDPTPERAMFLDAENQEVLRDWNCVINRIPRPLTPGNVDAFAEAVRLARQGDPEALRPFRIRGELERTLSADAVLDRYLKEMLGTP